ncbi:hypothetical protein A2U01_0089059, partial [Trifolium medium]|nr:hypothetical protein [Trifolium medium]
MLVVRLSLRVSGLLPRDSAVSSSNGFIIQ